MLDELRSYNILPNISPSAQITYMSNMHIKKYEIIYAIIYIF
jgi:hypothetical protein